MWRERTMIFGGKYSPTKLLTPVLGKAVARDGGGQVGTAPSESRTWGCAPTSYLPTMLIDSTARLHPAGLGARMLRIWIGQLESRGCTFQAPRRFLI